MFFLIGSMDELHFGMVLIIAPLIVFLLTMEVKRKKYKPSHGTAAIIDCHNGFMP